MSIDWASLAAEAFSKKAEEAAKNGETASKSHCSRFSSGNNEGVVGTDENMQAIDFKALDSACSHVPTVPHDFKGTQVADSCDYLFVIDETPDDEGPHGGFAPEKKDPAPGCASCANLATPGLSSGYCGAGRADLAPAYGDGHPLRKLPADGGEGCPLWEYDGHGPGKRPESWGAALANFRRR